MTQHSSQAGAGVESLAQRHLVEETFHDEKAYTGVPPARTDFYPEWMAEEHMQMLLQAAGPLSGKRVLDFGCGRGESGRIYAEQGAALVEGFDISGENIAIANKNAKRDGLDQRVFFRRLAAEEIDYPSSSFDVIIGKAILHHTDLEKTAGQLDRVLAPGGVAVFLEPLAHNPILNLFRRLTPSRRTPTEKPLSLKDLEVFRRHFGSVTYRGFYLFTLAAHFLLFVTGSRTLFARSRALMRKWEEPVLVRFPWLQRFCWSALVVFRKSGETPQTASWPAGQVRVELS
jgi:2-polyprenyl-3-methyl-5-hydroxy-6-metoxy-1,4-benzoquinol methylase